MRCLRPWSERQSWGLHLAAGPELTLLTPHPLYWMEDQPSGALVPAPRLTSTYYRPGPGPQYHYGKGDCLGQEGLEGLSGLRKPGPSRFQARASPGHSWPVGVAWHGMQVPRDGQRSRARASLFRPSATSSSSAPASACPGQNLGAEGRRASWAPMAGTPSTPGERVSGGPSTPLQGSQSPHQ